jgi:hypothetical protein
VKKTISKSFSLRFLEARYFSLREIAGIIVWPQILLMEEQEEEQ